MSCKPVRRGGRFDTGQDSYFTSYSLKYPFTQSVGDIGDHRVSVWSNDPALAPETLSDLAGRFAASNYDLREHMRDIVRAAEEKATPLACIILGKSLNFDL